jgi:mitochondrial transcription factor 1
VNPGTGLWSSKVHDYLKPRTHLLLEPEKDYIQSLLPLLNQPESTYRHVQLSGMEWSSYEKIIHDGLLPDQKILKEGDPGYGSINTTLLFIANLGQYPERKWGDFKSISHLMIHQLITAIRTRSLFHQYGFVRMLIWTMDAAKTALLPRTVANRRRFTIQAEVACERIHEVAGAEGGPGKNRRDIDLDIASSRRVATLLEQGDLGTPEDWKGADEKATEGNATQEGQETERSDASTSGRLWRKELQVLVEDYESNKFSRFTAEQGGQAGGRSPTKNYARLSHLRTFASQMQKRKTEVDRLLKMEEKLEADEESIMFRKPEQRHGELARLAENYRKEMEKHPISVQEGLALASDDRRAFAADPPLLMWDRRTREPIVVKNSEFQPEVRGCSFIRCKGHDQLTPFTEATDPPRSPP